MWVRPLSCVWKMKLWGSSVLQSSCTKGGQVPRPTRSAQEVSVSHLDWVFPRCKTKGLGQKEVVLNGESLNRIRGKTVASGDRAMVFYQMCLHEGVAWVPFVTTFAQRNRTYLHFVNKQFMLRKYLTQYHQFQIQMETDLKKPWKSATSR